jgi:hemerythrin-like metal-binding protein
MKPSPNCLVGIASTPFGLSTLSLKRLIAWGDHYKVGQPQLDAQHEAIFDIALETADLWQRRGNLQQLKDITEKLFHVLAAHFRFEEQQFAETGYARLEEHCEEHRVMLDELLALRARLEAMKPGRVSSEPGFLVLSYMAGLTVGHLAHSDIDAIAARMVVGESTQGHASAC